MPSYSFVAISWSIPRILKEENTAVALENPNFYTIILPCAFVTKFTVSQTL